jgi:hypothetical protein
LKQAARLIIPVIIPGIATIVTIAARERIIIAIVAVTKIWTGYPQNAKQQQDYSGYYKAIFNCLFHHAELIIKDAAE